MTNYIVFTIITLILSFAPMSYYIFEVVHQTDYMYYFTLIIGLPIFWLVSYLVFVTIHGRVCVRLFLPSIKEGSYPIKSSQNLIYSIRLSADNMAKYWTKTFEVVPFLTQLFLNKFYLSAYGVKFGKNTYIATEVRIDGVPLIEFGSNLFIGPRAIVGAHINLKGGNILYKKVKVGNNCFIGNNAVITPGGKMADNSILGGFSVTLLNIEISEGETWVGMPAKPLKKNESS
jgi:acetyltransferase-like isoleucine patch superfamily enzyme